MAKAVHSFITGSKQIQFSPIFIIKYSCKNATEMVWKIKKIRQNEVVRKPSLCRSAATSELIKHIHTYIKGLLKR